MSSFILRGVLADLQQRLDNPPPKALARQEVVVHFGTMKEHLEYETDAEYARRLGIRAVHIQRLIDCAHTQLEQTERAEGLRDD